MTDLKEYGRALFLLASEEGTENKVHEDARVLSEVLNSAPVGKSGAGIVEKIS